MRLGAPDVAREEQLVERVSLHAEKIVLQWENFDVQGGKSTTRWRRTDCEREKQEEEEEAEGDRRKQTKRGEEIFYQLFDTQ